MDMNTENNENEKLEKDLSKAINSIEAPKKALFALLDQKEKSRKLIETRPIISNLFISMSTKFYLGVGVALFVLLVAGGVYLQFGGQSPVDTSNRNITEQPTGNETKPVDLSAEQMADGLNTDVLDFSADLAELDGIVNDKSLDTLDSDMNAVVGAL
jgi:hypothetical protein